MLHPNMRVLAPNIRFFVKNSASGIFEQGDAFCNAGDFVLMRNWVISHLMWNPNLNEDVLFKEFLYGYYGKEVGDIFKEYIDVIHDRAEASGQFIGCFTEGLRWMDTKTFNKASALIQKANETAQRLEKQNPKKYAGLVNKVRRESLSFQHTSVVYYKTLQKKADLEGLKIDLPENPKALVEYLISTWKEFKVETWREFTTPADFEIYQQNLREDMVRQLFAKNIKLPTKNKSEQFSFYAPEFDFINSTKRVKMSAELVADNNASTKYAVKVPTNLTEHIRIPIDLSDLKFDKKGDAKIELFALVRADAGKAKKDNYAVRLRLTTVDWKILATRNIKIGEVDDKKYKVIKICEKTINKSVGSMFVEMRPHQQTVDADGVYIDRIFAIQK